VAQESTACLVITETRFTTFAETERDLIARALESTNGNKTAAASRLSISRKKLYAKITKYQLFTA
jgi:DNA-binding NtrC family response regulator